MLGAVFFLFRGKNQIYVDSHIKQLLWYCPLHPTIDDYSLKVPFSEGIYLSFRNDFQKRKKSQFRFGAALFNHVSLTTRILCFCSV